MGGCYEKGIVQIKERRDETELLKNDIFSSLRCHDVQNHYPFQELHSTQISKVMFKYNVTLLQTNFHRRFNS